MPVIQIVATVATMQMTPARQPINRISCRLVAAAAAAAATTTIIITAVKRVAAVEEEEEEEGAAVAATVAARAARRRSECKSWTLVCWASPSTLPQTGSMLDQLIQSPL